MKRKANEIAAVLSDCELLGIKTRRNSVSEFCIGEFTFKSVNFQKNDGKLWLISRYNTLWQVGEELEIRKNRVVLDGYSTKFEVMK